MSFLKPAQFGQFDLQAKGDNFSEFIPANPEFTPADVPFDVDARGGWDGGEVSIELGVLQLGDNRIEVQGEVHLPPDTATTRLLLSAHGDKLADLGQFKGLNLPAEEFHIDALLQGNSGALEIPELDASIGDSNLLGSLYIDFAEKPEIRINLDSEFFDLAQLLPAEDSVEAGEAATQSTIAWACWNALTRISSLSAMRSSSTPDRIEASAMKVTTTRNISAVKRTAPRCL